LQDLAGEVHSLFGPSDVLAIDLFEDKLTTAGLRPEDSYLNDCWLVGSTRVFSVTDGFPRITAADAPGGVESVSYSIDLGQIGDYEIDESGLLIAIKEAISGV
jgi:hypothetical protein